MLSIYYLQTKYDLEDIYFSCYFPLASIFFISEGYTVAK